MRLSLTARDDGSTHSPPCSFAVFKVIPQSSLFSQRPLTVHENVRSDSPGLVLFVRLQRELTLSPPDRSPNDCCSHWHPPPRRWARRSDTCFGSTLHRRGRLTSPRSLPSPPRTLVLCRRILRRLPRSASASSSNYQGEARFPKWSVDVRQRSFDPLADASQGRPRRRSSRCFTTHR